ncbi:hypothetical protein Acr_00g0086360 [Actinidia rufa]|uniref:Integrase catalytic domain-containing protein n=1 Tax=Actinidia rufa TaxID=165716 RepID=A0A7J0DVX1_9ERIC|nr:hypothetical protein Acr_00g0086360 [Actinidia rufa]
MDLRRLPLLPEKRDSAFLARKRDGNAILKRKNRAPKEDGSLPEQIGHKSTTPKPNRTKSSLIGVKSRQIEKPIGAPEGCRSPAKSIALFTIMALLPPSFTEFQQYRAFLATFQGDSTQASVMTTTLSVIVPSLFLQLALLLQMALPCLLSLLVLYHHVLYPYLMSFMYPNCLGLLSISQLSDSGFDVIFSSSTCGVQDQSSCFDTPAQNGRAERKHRHLLDTARSLLLSSSVPSVFWGQAILTAAYLLNRMLTHLLFGRSPYECLHGQVPNSPFFECLDLVVLSFSLEKIVLSLVLAAPVAKENLIYLDHFPSDVPTEEYSFTLDIVDIPLPATSPDVSDCPPPPTTSSLPSLIPPAPLVYSRRCVAPPIPSSSSVAPSSDSGNLDSPASRYPTRPRHPPSPRAWYARFQSVSLQIGFQPSVHDSALFVRHTSHGLVLLLLYVDNMIITGSDSEAISEVKDHLFREFEMKDFGPLRYFLDIEVASSPKGYLSSQTKYITDIIHRVNLTDDKTVDTPLELHAKFSAIDGVLC